MNSAVSTAWMALNPCPSCSSRVNVTAKQPMVADTSRLGGDQTVRAHVARSPAAIDAINRLL
jgi:hypothetical protein